MKKITLVSFVAASVMALAGCATPGTPEYTSQMDKMKQGGIGAGIGCVSGALLASATNGKPWVGCALGAAAGGLIGFVKAREEELAAMKEAQAMFPGSKLDTQPVAVADKSSGEKQQVEAFRSLSVPLSPRALTDPDGQKVFSNLGVLALKNNAVVTVAGGTASQRDQAIELVKRSGAKNVTVDPVIKTSIGRKGDLVVIVAPANKSAEFTV